MKPWQSSSRQDKSTEAQTAQREKMSVVEKKNKLFIRGIPSRNGSKKQRPSTKIEIPSVFEKTALSNAASVPSISKADTQGTKDTVYGFRNDPSL